MLLLHNVRGLIEECVVLGGPNLSFVVVSGQDYSGEVIESVCGTRIVDCDDELVLILVSVYWAVEHGVVLTANAGEQIGGAILHKNAGVSAKFIGEEFLVGSD